MTFHFGVSYTEMPRCPLSPTSVGVRSFCFAFLLVPHLSLSISLSISLSLSLVASPTTSGNSKTKGASFCVLFEKTTSLYRGVECETNIKKPFFCGRAFVLVYRVVSEMSSMAETSVEISPMLGAQ